MDLLTDAGVHLALPDQFSSDRAMVARWRDRGASTLLGVRAPRRLAQVFARLPVKPWVGRR